MSNDDIKILMIQIENKRKQMIDLAKEKPLTDPEIIEISQQLDILLNEFGRFTKKCR